MLINLIDWLIDWTGKAVKKYVKMLGATLDQQLTFQDHVNAVLL